MPQAEIFRRKRPPIGCGIFKFFPTQKFSLQSELSLKSSQNNSRLNSFGRQVHILFASTPSGIMTDTENKTDVKKEKSANKTRKLRKRPSKRTMHLMYTIGPDGKRQYTLKKVVDGVVAKSAHPARFSPDDKYSR